MDSREKSKIKQRVPPCIEDLIWFAGFFDGEGYIGLHRRNTRLRCLLIEVSGTYFPAIAKIRDMWQLGSTALMKEAPKSTRPAWKWTAASNDALFILRAIFPYLVVKKREAEIAIPFQETKSGRTGAHATEINVLDEEIAAI